MKDDMTALMVDPRLWSPAAEGVVVAKALAVRIPPEYQERRMAMPKLADEIH